MIEAASMHPLLPLFAYGTLRDPEYQRELFDRTFPMRRAVIAGFHVVSMAGGYLAAAALASGTIAGVLVEIDADAYAIADAWEDLTVYERIRVVARHADGALQCCHIYVVPGARGAAVTDGRLTDRPRAAVIADIRRFRAAFVTKDQP